MSSPNMCVGELFLKINTMHYQEGLIQINMMSATPMHSGSNIEIMVHKSVWPNRQ